MSKSNANEVVLRHVQTEATGKYKCEVSSDAPNFYTMYVSGYLYVIGMYLCMVQKMIELIKLYWY